jgi:4-amino-4-deoxy-L-arabinose transferase-like glycosyltransferase
MAVFMSGTLFCFILGVYEPAGPSRRWLFLGLYTCAALATLTKGLMGFLVTGAVMFLWLLLLNQWKRLRPLYLPTGIILFLAITLPWHVLAAQRNETWVHRYIVFEHFLRFLTPVASRPGPWHYFIWVIIGGLIPWTGFIWPRLAATFRAGWSRRTDHGQVWFLITWVVFIFLFFTKSKSKLAPYVLPVFPALAVLVGAELAQAWRENRADPLRAGWRVFSFLCGLLAIALILVVALPALFKMDAAQAFALRTPAAGLAMLLLFGGVLVPWLARHRGVRPALVGIGAMMAVFYCLLEFAAPALNKPGTRELALWVKAHARPEDRVFHCYDFYQDFTFYAERFVGVVGSNHAELELEEDAAAQASGRFLSDEQLLAQWTGAGRIFLVVQKRKIEQVKAGYAQALGAWARQKAEAQNRGGAFIEPEPARPLFATPSFQYHLIAETPDYSLLSNQP